MLYHQLLGAGVRIYEYCERPLHGKVALIDDEWATVGSSNLDPLSLALNLEANVIIRDRDFNQHLYERLDHLMQHSCQQIEREALGELARLAIWCAASWPITSRAATRAGLPGCPGMCRACCRRWTAGCKRSTPATRSERWTRAPCLAMRWPSRGRAGPRRAQPTTGARVPGGPGSSAR